jgi:diguanylate cyclase (GGDEF)-like protein/PAS domain S-box-containing protein
MDSLAKSKGSATLRSEAYGENVDTTADVTCVVGFDGQIQEFNAGSHDEIDRGVGEFVGVPYIDFIHPGDRNNTLERTALLTTSGARAVDIDNRFRCGAGLYRWLHWRVTVGHDERVLHYLGHDMTDLKMRENAPTSDAEHDLMFAATDAIVVTNATGDFTYLSPTAFPLLGYAPEELVGKRLTRLIHPEDRALAGVARKSAARSTDVRNTRLRYRRKDGSYAWIESRSRSVMDPATGAMHETQAVLRDIGDRVDTQLSMERQALTDPLTGLANRTLLSDRLSHALRHLKRNAGLVGLLMLDLDHFKVINDTLGHEVGDAVLVDAARRIQRLARAEDTVARFGGDEFVVVVHGMATSAKLTTFAERIVAGLRAPYRIGTEDIVTTVSIGIATTSRPDHLPADLLREADLAMFRAKDRGRDRQEVYGEALQARAIERLTTERLLRSAISERRMAVEYQPIVDLATGATVGAEALLRINDIDLGRSLPGHVVSVAEESGLLAGIDEWVRAKVLTQLAAWRSSRTNGAVGRVAVNVTARELVSADFASRLTTSIHDAGLEGCDLAVEVTEHVLLQTSNSAISSLAELRNAGVRVGVDDFGTGFSALAHLQSLPLDFLKIDKSFVERITFDSRSSAIVAAIIGLAHALGLEVVAEGVESSEQMIMLRGFGCNMGQGFVFAHPLSPIALTRFLKARPGSLSGHRTRLKQSM